MLRIILVTWTPFMGACASLRDPRVQGQGAGIAAQVDVESRSQRGDTFNDSSVFWALVVNNALIALGLPLIGGLWWFKRRQMLGAEVQGHATGAAPRPSAARS